MSNDFPFAVMLEMAAAEIKRKSTFFMSSNFFDMMEKEERCAEMTVVSIHKEDRGPWAFSVLRYLCNISQNPLCLIWDIKLLKEVEDEIGKLCKRFISSFVKILYRYDVQISENHYKQLGWMYGEEFITSLDLPTAHKDEDRRRNISAAKTDKGKQRFIKQYQKMRTALIKLMINGYITQRKERLEIDPAKLETYEITDKINAKGLSYILRKLLGKEKPCAKYWQKVFVKSSGGPEWVFKDDDKEQRADLDKIIKELKLQQTQ